MEKKIKHVPILSRRRWRQHKARCISAGKSEYEKSKLSKESDSAFPGLLCRSLSRALIGGYLRLYADARICGLKPDKFY